VFNRIAKTKGTPTPTPTPMPVLSPVVRPGQDDEGVCVEVLVEMLVEVAVELAVHETVILLALITNPRLVRVLLMKPGGLPVDTNCPVGSEICNAKLGLMDNALWSMLSPLPIVHV